MAYPYHNTEPTPERRQPKGYPFEVTVGGFNDANTKQVFDILEDDLGWTNFDTDSREEDEGWERSRRRTAQRRHRFIDRRPAQNLRSVDIRLRSRGYMRKNYPKDLWGLSVATVRDADCGISIDRTNWDAAGVTPSQRNNYRKYLITHEMGHCLGYGHVKPPARKGKEDPVPTCPVMYQQTCLDESVCSQNMAVGGRDVRNPLRMFSRGRRTNK